MTIWVSVYHFAAAAVWCAFGLDNDRLLISRLPEAMDDGVLGLDTEDKASSFVMT